MNDLLLGILAFAITAAEEFVSTRRTQAIVAKKALRTANWSAAFDFILFIDFYLIISHFWLIVPIVIGSWVSSYYSIHLSNKESQ